MSAISAAGRRRTATALRSAPELERDATVVARLGEELGRALSALACESDEQWSSAETQTQAVLVWAESGADADDTLADLRAGALAVHMELVSNPIGETVMRATFHQDGDEQTTEDIWFGIRAAAQEPSRFAEAFREAAACLSPQQQTMLAEQLKAAQLEISESYAALLHQLSARELRDCEEHQRLTLLIVGGRS